MSDKQDTPYGQLGAHLSCFPLAQICDPAEGVQTGPFGSQLHQRDYVAAGTPIITVEHLGENRILHQDLPKVKEDDRLRLARYSLKQGDIVFSRVGSVDRRSLVRKQEDGWLFSGRCLRVRPNPAIIDSGFLSWFFGLSAFKDYIRRIAVGATMPSLNTDLLSKIPVYFPPLPEQQSIGFILGTLDDKIELNRRMNRTLESIARAIFKSWFIDLEPIPGMEPHKEWEDSVLGKIPKGWEAAELRSRACSIEYGLTRSASSERIGPKFLRITDIRGGSINWATVPFVAVSEAEYKRYCLKKGDIVVARTGASTGENTFIAEDAKAVFASYLVRIQFTETSIARIVALSMRSKSYFEYVDGIIGGSAQPNASAQVLSAAQCIFPPLSIANKFYEIVDPLDCAMVNLSRQSNNLALIRDTLLPKLLSGEIRIKDAEKIVSQAV